MAGDAKDSALRGPRTSGGFPNADLEHQPKRANAVARMNSTRPFAGTFDGAFPVQDGDVLVTEHWPLGRTLPKEIFAPGTSLSAVAATRMLMSVKVRAASPWAAPR
jgi:hypothetical protein